MASVLGNWVPTPVYSCRASTAFAANLKAPPITGSSPDAAVRLRKNCWIFPRFFPFSASFPMATRS